MMVGFLGFESDPGHKPEGFGEIGQFQPGRSDGRLAFTTASVVSTLAA